jgi:hypothetical protein
VSVPGSGADDERSRRLLLGAVVMYNGSHALHGLRRHPDAVRQREFEGLQQWVDTVRETAVAHA